MRRFVRSMIPAGLALFGACCTDAFAQGANPYNGCWALQLETPQRLAVQGSVEVKDEGGAYTTVSHDRRDACAGREAPIVVRAATPGELTFRVMRSTVLAGCPDFQVQMKRVDDTRLEGALGNGWKAQMTRQ